MRELLAGPGWAGPLGEAGTILLRAPRSGRALFFGGHGAPLHRGDPRVWDIPLATRRPTFRELQRVLQVLAMVHIHGESLAQIIRFFFLFPDPNFWEKGTIWSLWGSPATSSW